MQQLSSNTNNETKSTTSNNSSNTSNISNNNNKSNSNNCNITNNNNNKNFTTFEFIKNVKTHSNTLFKQLPISNIINNKSSKRTTMITSSTPIPSSLSDTKEKTLNTSKSGVQHTNTYYFCVEFVAGALGGVVSRTATAPIDRLRTFLQVYSVEQNRPNLKYTKIWTHMIQEGSYISLWRGNLVNVLKTAPENAIKLVTYEQLKALMQANRLSQTNTITERFMCGSAAGLVSQMVMFPLKTVKVVMNLRNTGEYKGIIDCINKMYKKNGLRSFYRGLVPNSLAIMPASGIDLAAYETFKQHYSKTRNKEQPNVMERLLIGNISSAIGNFAVYPLIFVRTRLQSNRNLNETTLSLLLHVWRKDGLFGMYRGFLLHVLKIGPAASLSYITFEYITRYWWFLYFLPTILLLWCEGVAYFCFS